MFLFSSDEYSAVQLLDHMVIFFFFLRNLYTIFHSVFFPIHTKVEENSMLKKIIHQFKQKVKEYHYAILKNKRNNIIIGRIW